MNAIRTAAVGLAVVAVVTVVAAVAVVGFGVDGLRGDDGAVTTVTPDMSDTEAAFDITVDDVDDCGRTCRNVTVTLRNVGSEAAENVTVRTNVYTGGDRVWTGSEPVGPLGARESYTAAKAVDLGLADSLEVEENDGSVTIAIVVRFDDGTEVFTADRRVG